MSKTLVQRFTELQATVAPATVKDLDGSYVVDCPLGYVSVATQLHYADVECKSKWDRQGPFQSDEEWAEQKLRTPTKTQAMKSVAADWAELMLCDEEDCDTCRDLAMPSEDDE
jgi:hypothetical protein